MTERAMLHVPCAKRRERFGTTQEQRVSTRSSSTPRRRTNRSKRLDQKSLETSPLARECACNRQSDDHLARDGQEDLENHLRLRAPQTWQGVQTQVEKYVATFCEQTPQPLGFCAVTWGNGCWHKDETCKTCGKTWSLGVGVLVRQLSWQQRRLQRVCKS